jgi:hypothetical protein
MVNGNTLKRFTGFARPGGCIFHPVVFSPRRVADSNHDEFTGTDRNVSSSTPLQVKLPGLPSMFGIVGYLIHCGRRKHIRDS